MKLCKQCNQEIVYKNKYHYQRALVADSICRRCSITNINKSVSRTSSKNGQWKGYEEIPYSWFSKYFERTGRKRTGNISIKQVYDMWIKQNKKCALSGVNIGFRDDKKGHTCSIDRIDSKKEYIIENIQLVHKDVNLMKNKFDNDYFIKMCKMISELNN